MTVTALILAGGKSSRMGGNDKAMITFNEKKMIEHVINSFKEHVSDIIISANRNLEAYQSFGYPVLPDELSDSGPLAGILRAMQNTRSDYLLVSPCDTPLIEAELAARLLMQANQVSDKILVAHDGERMQMLHALLPTTLKQSLEQYLAGGDRQVMRWYKQNNCVAVDCSDLKSGFANINTAEDLKKFSRP